MSIKLRLLLFYLEHFDSNDLTVAPHVIRAENVKKLKTLTKIIDYAPEPLHEVRDQTITVRDGAEIKVRIYRPKATEELPLIMYYHGGGFVERNIDSHDKVCRRISKLNDAVVVSVNYRLAPEYKFPIPHQDCYDATLWAVDNSKMLKADPMRMTVMGDSAGANIATVVSILARDNNGPQIANQVLIYPVCDSSKDYDTELKYGKGYFLSKERINWFRDHYINEPSDVFNPLVSPLLTENLAHLPRTFLFTAECDPLRAEGKAYADKLRDAGNEVLYKDYPKMIHGFINMPKICNECATANEDIKTFLAADK